MRTLRQKPSCMQWVHDEGGGRPQTQWTLSAKAHWTMNSSSWAKFRAHSPVDMGQSTSWPIWELPKAELTSLGSW